MPHHKSNVKRMRQNPIRATRNKSVRAEFRSAVRDVRDAAAEGSVEKAEASLKNALTIIGKTQKKGIIHKNKAARQQSRLMKRVNALSRKSES
jgi:small subunit ribosomal protein S20